MGVWWKLQAVDARWVSKNLERLDLEEKLIHIEASRKLLLQDMQRQKVPSTLSKFHRLFPFLTWSIDVEFVLFISTRDHSFDILSAPVSLTMISRNYVIFCRSFFSLDQILPSIFFKTLNRTHLVEVKSIPYRKYFLYLFLS